MGHVLIYTAKMISHDNYKNIARILTLIANCELQNVNCEL
jgi:hypothetical protein